MKKAVTILCLFLLCFMFCSCSEKNTPSTDPSDKEAEKVEEAKLQVEEDKFPVGHWIPESGSMSFSFELQDGGKGVFFLHGKEDGRLAEWVLSNDTLYLNFTNTDNRTYHYEYKVEERNGEKVFVNSSEYADEEVMILDKG